MSQVQTVNNTLRLSSKNQVTTSNDSSDKVDCSKCEKQIKPKDKAIQCATCQLIYHAKCQKVSDAKYEALKEEDEDMFWFCLSCRRTTVNLIQTTAGIEKRVTALEAVMDQKAEKDDVKELENRVQLLEESVQDRFAKLEGDEGQKSEEIEKKIEEKIVEKIEEKKIESTKPTTSVQEAVEEVKEQERRKCNVVLFNVPESESVDNETRRQHDIEVLEALMKEGILITAEIKTDRRGVKMVITWQEGRQQNQTPAGYLHIRARTKSNLGKCKKSQSVKKRDAPEGSREAGFNTVPTRGREETSGRKEEKESRGRREEGSGRLGDLQRKTCKKSHNNSEQSFLGRVCQNKLAMCLFFTG